jgi:membrane protein implicated in regulation of membrane protease activity
MDRRGLWIRIGGLVLAGMITILALVLLTPPEFQIRASMIGGVVVLAGAFLLSQGKLQMDFPGNGTLGVLATSLRERCYRVEERKNALKVHLNWLTQAMIKVKSDGTKAELICTADATPTGWSIIIILLLFGIIIGGAFVIPIILYAYWRAQSFGFTELPIAVAAMGAVKRERENRGTRVALIDGLAEAHRLAAETYEAERSNLQDVELIAIVLEGVVGWLVLLILFSQLPVIAASGLSPTDAALLALVLAFIATAITILVVRRRYRPRLQRYWEWKEKLRIALSRETEGIKPDDVEPSAVELLFDVGKELPDWFKTRRQGAAYLEPGNWLILSFLAIIGSSMLLPAIYFVLVGLTPDAWWVMAIGGGIVAGTVALYFYWSRGQKERERELMSQYNERLRTFEDQAMRTLEEL